MMRAAWLRELKPLVVPPLWELRQEEEHPEGLFGGWFYLNRLTSHTLILSGGTYDGQRWLHMSLGHPSRLPTWGEFVDAKEWAMGVERFAAQLIPPRSQYVNFHPYVLHLYSPVGPWPWPDFRDKETGIV